MLIILSSQFSLIHLLCGHCLRCRIADFSATPGTDAERLIVDWSIFGPLLWIKELDDYFSSGGEQEDDVLMCCAIDRYTSADHDQRRP